MRREPVTVTLATFPPRLEGLRRTVADILPQLNDGDRLCVYLNLYTEPPDFILDAVRTGKLEYVIGRDLGSQGKLWWLGERTGYYLTIDDDILYPRDYVSRLVGGIDKYDRSAWVSYHGAEYHTVASGALAEPDHPRTARECYPYFGTVMRDVPVNTVGNGCGGCYPGSFGLTFDMIATGELHSGDDEDVAIWAQKHGVPLVVLAHRIGWLRANEVVTYEGAMHRNQGCISASAVKLNTWKRWQTHTYTPLGVVPVAPVPEWQPTVHTRATRVITYPPFTSTLSVSMAVGQNVAPELLRKAVSSVLGQSLTGFTLYVAFDGKAPDHLASVINEFDDTRITVLECNGKGAYACHKATLAACTSEWWCVHDSDDWSEPGRLSALASGITEHTDAVFGGYTEHRDGDAGRKVPPCVPHGAPRTPELLYSSSWHTAFIRTDVLRRIGINENYRCGYDSAIQAALWRTGGAATVDDCSYHYVRHPESLTQHADTNFMSTYRAAVNADLRDVFSRLPCTATIDEIGYALSVSR